MSVDDVVILHIELDEIDIDMAPAAPVAQRSEVSMVTRTSTTTVIFTRPFRLSAMDEQQPPGVYTVETDEELLETVSFPAYRRLATWICIPLHSGAVGSLGDGDTVLSDAGRAVGLVEDDVAALRPHALDDFELGLKALRLLDSSFFSNKRM
jgi:hypothetical protein